MESLKNIAAPIDAVAMSGDDAVDRIVLRRSESAKLDGWLDQLNAKYDGLIRFSKSDLANFLIRHHEDTLSESELKLLGAELYDEMRWISRAIEKVRQAKRDGVAIRLEDVMVKRKPIERLKSSLQKKTKQKRDKRVNDDTPSSDQVESTDAKIHES